MPQLQQIATTYASQLFWLLLVFGILYFGIARAMLPKVGRVIERREAKIAGDLAEAQQAQANASAAEAVQAATLAKAREEAQGIVGEASATISEETGRRLAGLDAELANQQTEAEARIASAREAALADLGKVATEAAAEVVARLTGSEPSAEAVASAVASTRTGEA